MNRKELRLAGWTAYHNRGESYNKIDEPNIWLLKSGNGWAVTDANLHATVAEGKTIKETLNNWKGTK